MAGQKKAVGFLDIVIVLLIMLAVVSVAPLLLSPVHDPTGRAFMRYLLYLVMAAVAVLACKIGKRPVFKTLGFKRGAVGRQLLLVLPFFAATALIFVLMPLLLGVPKTMLLDRKITNPAALTLQVIHLMIFVGPVEELIFRGFFYERLKAETNAGLWAAVLTAAAFGFWHFPANQDFLQVLLTAVIGLIYGFGRLKFKNCTTLTLAVAHGLHDTFILVLGCVLL